MATRERTVAERHLDQPYEISLVRREADDGLAWSAQVVELQGCEARGATEEEAVARVREAMIVWVEDALESGRAVPPPKAASGHSGRLLVRMPPALHSELARMADREKVSLNTLIVGLLGGAASWRQPGEAGDPPPVTAVDPSATSADVSRNDRLASWAFGAGLVVSGLAAVAAIVLVVILLAG